MTKAGVASTVSIALGIAIFALAWIWIWNHVPFEGFWTGYLHCLISIIAMTVGGNLVKRGLRLIQPPSEDLLSKDRRRPILLLRSFSSEKRPFSRLETNPISGVLARFNPLEHTGRTLEEYLVPHLSKLGPVVALGDPSEQLTPLGASRMYVRDRNWQEAFCSLSLKASVIVVIYNNTASLNWEVAHLIDSGILFKTLLIPHEDAPKENEGLSLHRLLKSHIGLQSVNQDTAAISFPPRGARQFRARGKGRRSAIAAIEKGIDEICHRIGPSCFERPYCTQCGEMIPTGGDTCTSCGWLRA